MPDDADLPPPPPPDIDIPLDTDFPHHLDMPPSQDLPRPTLSVHDIPRPQANNPHPRPKSSEKKKFPAWLPRAMIGGAIVLVIILLIVLAPKPQSADDLATEDDTAAEVANGEDEEASSDEASTDGSGEPADDGEPAADAGSDEGTNGDDDGSADPGDRSFPSGEGDENGSDAAYPVDEEDSADDAASTDDTDASAASDPTATPPTSATQQEPTITPLPGAPAAGPPPGASDPTTTPLPQPAPPGPDAAGGDNDGPQPAFQDQFEDNRNAWTTGRFNDMETSSIENGVLRVAWDGRGSSYEVYSGQVFNNFIAEVDCAVVKGGDDASCGIILTTDQSAGAYEFEVLNDLYRLGYYNQNGEALEVPMVGDPTGIIKPNQTNHLELKHEGGETSLYLNGELLDSSSEVVLPSGTIGVSTNSYSEDGAEVLIDNFTIWALP